MFCPVEYKKVAEDEKVPSLLEHISVTQRELLEEFPADAFANLSNTHTNFL